MHHCDISPPGHHSSWTVWLIFPPVQVQVNTFTHIDLSLVRFTIFLDSGVLLDTDSFPLLLLLHPASHSPHWFPSAIWVLKVFCLLWWPLHLPAWTDLHFCSSSGVYLSHQGCPRGVPADSKATDLPVQLSACVHSPFGLTQFGTSIGICFNHLWPKARSYCIVSCPFKISGTVSPYWDRREKKMITCI